MRRSNVLAAFDAAAAATPMSERPMFEWVHVMAPHAPWVFDRNGNPVNDMPGLTWQEPVSGPAGRADRIQRTFSYVEYVNERTLSLVDRLVERDPAGVIIILSDHGSDTAFDARDPVGSDLNERSSNVFASRTPGRSGLFPDGTTPINVLPRLLNAYLGTSLPIQQDTTWTWRPGRLHSRRRSDRSQGVAAVRGASVRGIAARLAGLLAELVSGFLRRGRRPQPDRGRRDRHPGGIRALIVAVLVTVALAVAGRRLTRQADRGTFWDWPRSSFSSPATSRCGSLRPEQSRLCSDRPACGAEPAAGRFRGRRSGAG